jgi:hypothetical protein
MDIFKLNLKLSFRQLAGNKLYTFVNVLGLTIGFAAFISIFFWRQSELQTDRFHENAENIFLLTVQTDSTTDHVRARYGGVAEKVGMKYPEVQSYTEIADVDVYLKNPDNAVEIKSQAITVHPGFFEMFDFKLIDYMGDSLMSEPNTIVLTQSLARKLFNDKNPLGEIITLQYSLIEPYKIVGIIEDVPDNSSFEFECIVPENEDGNYWGRMSFSFVELHDNTDIDQFAQKIKAESRSIYSNTRTKTLVRPFPFTDIYFNSDFAWFHHGDFQQVEILGIVALLILLVSIINYINLATAQAKNRAKEIGIKKITGASPVPVVRFAKGTLREGMDFVRELHQEVGSGVPFSYEFMDQRLGELYEKDQAITILMSTLSVIALVISCMGLFALSAYTVELRIREIGIRKVNGASIYNVFSMLSRDFLKWVIYAMIIALPLSWFLVHNWLQNYAYRTEIAWWIFAMGGFVTLIVSWITISYHSTRAAYTNPVKVLRSE